MTETIGGEAPVELTNEELLVLRYSCRLRPDEQAPFSNLDPDPDADRLEDGAQSLVHRGIADGASHRIDREVVRRLLVVSQPDARIVLLTTGPGQAERVLDLYERAGAFVAYHRHGPRHTFGPPLELVDVYDQILRSFTARGSTGDFVDVDLTAPEYFAFATFARDLASGLEGGPSRDQVLESTMNGAALIPGREKAAESHSRSEAQASLQFGSSFVPTEEEWQRALASLVKKDVLVETGDGLRVRSYLEDLARALTRRARAVLTRFDFGAEDWFVRDLTLVPVRGSLFLLRTTREGGLRIRELDADTMARRIRWTIGPYGGAE